MTKKRSHKKRRRYSPSSLTHHVSGTIRGLRRPRVEIDPSLRWFVLVTAPKRERQVRDDLNRAGIATYLPTMAFEVVRRGKRTEREKCPVAGYLFVGLLEGRSTAEAAVEGSKGILGASGEPMRIEAEALQTFSDILTGYRPDLAEEFDGQFKEGDDVRIAEGPFAGLTATISEILENGNVAALVSLFGRATPIECDAASLERRRDGKTC